MAPDYGVVTASDFIVLVVASPSFYFSILSFFFFFNGRYIIMSTFSTAQTSEKFLL